MAVKNVIHEVLSEELGGKQYNAEETATWTRAVSDSIKDKLKGNFTHTIQRNSNQRPDIIHKMGMRLIKFPNQNVSFKI